MVAALVAAGAEIWRFVLLLQGRTLVLSGSAVRASDVLVAAAGMAVVVSALFAVGFSVPALVRTHAVAARRLDRAPSRTTIGVVLRLLVPVWNLYGAGQITIEIDRMLVAAQPSGARRRRGRWIVRLWWCSWIVSAVLIVITLARGFGGSLQAIADTVELHIAVDLVAAVVAGLAVLMFARFVRLLDDRRATVHRMGRATAGTDPAPALIAQAPSGPAWGCRQSRATKSSGAIQHGDRVGRILGHDLGRLNRRLPWPGVQEDQGTPVRGRERRGLRTPAAPARAAQAAASRPATVHPTPPT